MDKTLVNFISFEIRVYFETTNIITVLFII